jgi:hypothetical protein
VSILSRYTSCSLTTPYAFSITVNNNNQITTSGFSYDAPGNLMNDGFNSYAYNAESEIKSAAGVTYTYDGDGSRIPSPTGKFTGTEFWTSRTPAGISPTNMYSFAGSAWTRAPLPATPKFCGYFTNSGCLPSAHGL